MFEDATFNRSTVVDELRKLLVQTTSTKRIQVCEVPQSGNPPALRVRIQDQSRTFDVSDYMTSSGYLDEDDSTTHSKSGGTQSSLGIIYHRLWCMWMILKLKDRETEYSLKPEYGNAGNIFLHFKDKLADQFINLFIQTKHKEKESIKLCSLEDLKKKKELLVPEDIANSLRNLHVSNEEQKSYFMLLTNANIECNIKDVKSEIINIPCLETFFQHGNLLQIQRVHQQLKVLEEQILFAVNQYSIDELESIIKDKLLEISNRNEILMKIKFSSLQILVQKSIESMDIFNIDNVMIDQHLTECDAIGQIRHNRQEPTSDDIGRIEVQEQASRVLLEQKGDSEIIDVLITGEEDDERTELARNIAYNCEEHFDHIIWIDGNNSKFDFGDLGKTLKLCYEESKEAMSDKALKQLNKFRTLLIYDNATKDTPLPTENYSNIYIIVTSKFNDRNSKLNIPLHEATFDECGDNAGEKQQTMTEIHLNRILGNIAEVSYSIPTLINSISVQKDGVVEKFVNDVSQVAAESVENLPFCPDIELFRDVAVTCLESVASITDGVEKALILTEACTENVLECFEQVQSSERFGDAVQVLDSVANSIKSYIDKYSN